LSDDQLFMKNFCDGAIVSVFFVTVVVRCAWFS